MTSDGQVHIYLNKFYLPRYCSEFGQVGLEDAVARSNLASERIGMSSSLHHFCLESVKPKVQGSDHEDARSRVLMWARTYSLQSSHSLKMIDDAKIPS